MNAILEALKGKKTYGIVAIFLLCVAAEKLVGLDIPGFQVGNDWLQMTLAMLGIGTLRAGISQGPSQ
jgi:hypothetical protein